MRTQTEKTTFSYKDDWCKALHIYWSGGKGLVHKRSARGAGHIPLCGIFLLMFIVKVGFLKQQKIRLNPKDEPCFLKKLPSYQYFCESRKGKILVPPHFQISKSHPAFRILVQFCAYRSTFL